MRSVANGFAWFACLALAVGCSGAGNGRGGGAQFVPQGGRSQGKIAHVVIIVQENRSFDNFFDCFPGTDCVKTAPGRAPHPGPTSAASPCPALASPSPGPTPKPIAITFNATLVSYDPDHRYCPSFVVEYDQGKLDGFYWDDGIQPNKPDGTYPYRVVAEKQIQPYWDLATQYVLADRAFATEASGSFTAHQDLVRGDTKIYSNASAVDYPLNSENVSNWGCDDAKDSHTPLLTTQGAYVPAFASPSPGPFPCFSYATLRDTLDKAGVSWKYYVPTWPRGGGQMWNAFDAIAAVRHDKSEWPNKAKFNCTKSCVSWPQTNVFCDVGGSTSSPCPAPSPPGKVVLPAVSWVIPDGADSDHSNGSQDNGPDWVASVVDAIGESPSWNSTAIIIVWDDWGGFYDHVPPPQLDSAGLGFRVPMMVVSPYAKTGYVSHTQYEFGSILKFVETTFGLPSLGTTDARANDITDPFDFSQKPRTFVPIKLLNARHDRRYFLTRPPSLEPVDDE